MARPRVFVSSTYYDLKHVRASLDIFIDSLGYDSILSEKGDIPYFHELPLDASCYREVDTADIFVLIVGGRYGSAASTEAKDADHFASVTKTEFDHAIKRDIPVFILVEAGVYAEYRTYQRNKDVKGVQYAHVDSVNVFRFLEEILSSRRNNPVFHFERVSEITTWLREQWAGLFREHLNRHTTQKQLAAFSDQIAELKDVGTTLRRYLEEVVKKVNVEGGQELIEDEKKRLIESQVELLLKSYKLVEQLAVIGGAKVRDIRTALSEAKSWNGFIAMLIERTSASVKTVSLRAIGSSPVAFDEANEIRAMLGLPPFGDRPKEDVVYVPTGYRDRSAIKAHKRDEQEKVE